MRYLILFIVFTLFSCSEDDPVNVPNSQTCYKIVSVESLKNGDFITIEMNGEKVKYKVTDYKTYLGKTTICNLNNL